MGVESIEVRPKILGDYSRTDTIDLLNIQETSVDKVLSESITYNTELWRQF